MGGGDKPYLRIVGGNVVQKVDRDTPNARRREYEVKGQHGVVHELVYMNWSGVIRDISVEKGKFGEQCTVEFDDAYLVLPTKGRYFQDMMCKLFSADLSKEVLLHPYNMEVEGKEKTGVSVQQDGEKLKSYFYDGEKNLHDFPVPTEEERDDWEEYFKRVRKFLVKKIEDLEFSKPMTVEEVEEVFNEGGKKLVEGLNEDDEPKEALPF